MTPWRNTPGVLAVGATAPDFEGIDQNGRSVKLAELLTRSAVVLYFYPKDFTPVCTAQACTFRDAYEELSGRGATVVGVSVDDGETHARFAKAHAVPYSLLSDPDQRIQRAYEARQVFGMMTKRVTYVIGQDGKVRGAFHSELFAGKHLDAVRKVLAGSSRAG